HRHLCVNLSGRKAGVSEKFLDVAKIGTGIEQMRSESVTEAVRRNVMNVSALFDVFVDHSADAAGCQAAAPTVQKHGLVFAFSGRTLGKKNSRRFLEIMHQRLKGRFAKRNDTLFFSFAGDSNEPFAKIYVLKIQRHQFADANPRRIQEFQYRS